MRAGMETPRRDRDHARRNASPGSAWAGVASSMVTVTSGSLHPRPHVSDCWGAGASPQVGREGGAEEGSLSHQVVITPTARRDLSKTSPRIIPAIVEFLYGDLAAQPRRVGKPL